MNMRDIINLLTEAKMETVEVFGKEVRVWINPTQTELFGLMDNVSPTLRGTLDNAGDLYVWDAGLAIHSSISKALGLSSQHYMMLQSDSVSLEYSVDKKKFRRIPAMRRAYGNYHYDIENDSAV